MIPLTQCKGTKGISSFQFQFQLKYYDTLIFLNNVNTSKLTVINVK